MIAGTRHLVCDQGSTFTLQVTWLDSTGAAVDLTGRTARLSVRPSLESSTVTASLTTENGGITLGGTAGTVDLLLSATASAAITAGTYVYDLEIVNGGTTVDKLIKGNFVVRREVTR